MPLDLAEIICIRDSSEILLFYRLLFIFFDALSSV